MINHETEQLLIGKETAIYAAYKQHAMSALEAALADDFHEIGGNGEFYSKPEVLQAMKEIRVLDYVLEEFRVLPLDERNAVVAYIVNMKRIENGAPTRESNIPQLDMDEEERRLAHSIPPSDTTAGYLNQFTPTRTCTVLIPGFGTVKPALEMCS